MDSRASLAYKQKFLPEESEIIAEAHFKLSLALEFASVTTSAEEGTEEDAAGSSDKKGQQVDQELRDEAARELEAAIASTKLKLQNKEVELATVHSPEDNESTRRQIFEVKEIIADMEQRVRLLIRAEHARLFSLCFLLLTFITACRPAEAAHRHQRGRQRCCRCRRWRSAGCSRRCHRRRSQEGGKGPDRTCAEEGQGRGSRRESQRRRQRDQAQGRCVCYYRRGRIEEGPYCGRSVKLGGGGDIVKQEAVVLSCCHMFDCFLSTLVSFLDPVGGNRRHSLNRKKSGETEEFSIYMLGVYFCRYDMEDGSRCFARPNVGISCMLDFLWSAFPYVTVDNDARGPYRTCPCCGPAV